MNLGQALLGNNEMENESLARKALDKYGPDGMEGKINKQNMRMANGIFSLPHTFTGLSSMSIPDNTASDPENVYAQGGIIKGKGTGTSDSISAKLPVGGAIIPAAVVKLKGKEFFDKLEAAAPHSGNEADKVDAKVSNGEFQLSAEAVEYWGTDFINDLIGKGDAENPAEDAVPGEEMAEAKLGVPAYEYGGIVEETPLQARLSDPATQANALAQNEALRAKMSAPEPSLSLRDRLGMTPAQTPPTMQERLVSSQAGAQANNEAFRARPEVAQTENMGLKARLANPDRIGQNMYDTVNNQKLDNLSADGKLNIGEPYKAAGPTGTPRLGAELASAAKGVIANEAVGAGRNAIYNALPKSTIGNVLNAGVSYLSGDEDAAKKQLFGQQINTLPPLTQAGVNLAEKGLNAIGYQDSLVKKGLDKLGGGKPENEAVSLKGNEAVQSQKIAGVNGLPGNGTVIDPAINPSILGNGRNGQQAPTEKLAEQQNNPAADSGIIAPRTSQPRQATAQQVAAFERENAAYNKLSDVNPNATWGDLTPEEQKGFYSPTYEQRSDNYPAGMKLSDIPRNGGNGVSNLRLPPVDPRVAPEPRGFAPGIDKAGGLNIYGQPVQTLGSGDSYMDNGVEVIPWGGAKSDDALRRTLTKEQYQAAHVPNLAASQNNESDNATLRANNEATVGQNREQAGLVDKLGYATLKSQENQERMKLDAPEYGVVPGQEDLANPTLYQKKGKREEVNVHDEEFNKNVSALNKDDPNYEKKYLAFVKYWRENKQNKPK